MNARRTDLQRGLAGQRFRGFTLQFFFITILPLTVLVLIVAFGSQTLHHNSMRELAGDRDLRAVRAAANTLTQEINHRETVLRLVAAQLSSAAQNEMDVSQILSDPDLTAPFDAGIALLDSNGRIVSGSINGISNIAEHLTEPAEGVAFSDPIQADDGKWTVLVSANIPGNVGDRPSARTNQLSSGSLKYRSNGSMWLYAEHLSQGAPIRLVGAFSPAFLASKALSGVATEQSSIILLSPDGELLFRQGSLTHTIPAEQHAGITEVLQGNSGVRYQQPEAPIGGVHPPWHTQTGEHVIAFSPVSPLGWGLVLEESWEEIASPLLRTTQTAPLVLAPVLLLTVLALWFGARQIVQPLQKLEKQASRLAAGDFSAVQEPVGGINEIMELQNRLTEMAGAVQSAQEALHSYIGALTEGVESERQSLARELHDDTLQALIALNQHVQLALLRTEDEIQRQSLLDLQTRVGQTIVNLRRAIGGLRPIYLEDLGLVAALGMLAQQSPPGPRISFSVEGIEHRLPPDTELAFYRIAQEAINNTIHHAGATLVEMKVAFSLAGAQLTIQDNGEGFPVPDDPGAFAHLGHYGLLGMRERAELAGASLQIQSSPDQGVFISLQWEPPENR